MTTPDNRALLQTQDHQAICHDSNVLAHPKPPPIATWRSGQYVGLARPSSPKHHMADPSANVQGLTRAPPSAGVMVKGQLAIAAPTPRGAMLAPVPHGARETQMPGFRFLLLL